MPTDRRPNPPSGGAPDDAVAGQLPAQPRFSAVFASPDFDGEIKRSLGKVWCQMASVGEVLACAHRITDGDMRSWRDEFADLAARTAAGAAAAESHGHTRSAHMAWLRACEYHRQSFFFDRHVPGSDVVAAGWAAQRDAFVRAMAHSPIHCEAVELPYDGDVTLGGYLLRPPGAVRPRPTVVLPGGFDGTAEEMWSLGAAGALARGWNAVMFDGPGQGGSLYRQRLVFRHDYEAVLGPVLAWVRARHEVDDTRVVLMGRSFGGYLVPRAAANLAGPAGPDALIADPGQPDTASLIAAKAAIEAPGVDMNALVGAGNAAAITAALDGVVNGPDPLASFFWTSRMATFGTATVGDFVLAAQAYVVDPAAITVPTVVTVAEADILAGEAQAMFDALGAAERTLLAFSVADGAGDHCEALNEELFEQRAFDWVDEVWR
jgi:dienelactone hydrolase